MIHTAILLILFYNWFMYLLLKENTTVNGVSGYFKYGNGTIVWINLVAVCVAIIGILFQITIIDQP